MARQRLQWPASRAQLLLSFAAMLIVAEAVMSDGQPSVPLRAPRENPPPKLDQTTYGELFDLCRPCADKEAWSEVNWIGEFWQGRQQAARLGKPMFIFAMNGHPLGCV